MRFRQLDMGGLAPHAGPRILLDHVYCSPVKVRTAATNLSSAAIALERSGTDAPAGGVPLTGAAGLEPVPNEAFRFSPEAVRVGVISNPRSRQNKGTDLAGKVQPGMMAAAPASQEQLRRTLEAFADSGVELLVIDGGDGTVRDVITAMADAFGGSPPTLAVLPAGKTNALALDLGIAPGWTPADAVVAYQAGQFVSRSPVEIVTDSGVVLRGFIFGAGAFVRATELAQQTHAVGAFGALAVGLSTIGAIGQTCLGTKSNHWRAGDVVEIVDPATGSVTERNLYFLLGSTLGKLPLGVRPLGSPAPGLNMLAADAPPRLLPIAAVAIAAGSQGGWLERMGYHHRHDVSPFQLGLKSGFILDGELFSGGTITLRAGSPIRFVVP